MTVDGRRRPPFRAEQSARKCLGGVSDTADAPILGSSSGRGFYMNKDELEGKGEQLKGKVKQGLGKATDNERLHDEGVADEAAGDVQEGFGRARRKVGETIEDIGEDIKR
jgi:uncharacterized protein YjbJ (UPF0337 family)